MSINSYATTILNSIDFVNDWRFINTETEFAELCEHNLIEYLKLLISIYHSEENTKDDILEKINEQKEELLGENTLGEFSEVVIAEALYYYRLMLVPDKAMNQLIHIINLYRSGNHLKVITKINSLIMFNICTYGAGTSYDKPLFSLSVYEGITNEQRDLEVSIAFLLRNINDLHLTLAEPLFNHPLHTLLMDEDEDIASDTAVPDAAVPAEEEAELCTVEENHEKEVESLYTKGETFVFIGAITILLIVGAYLISHVRLTTSIITK